MAKGMKCSCAPADFLKMIVAVVIIAVGLYTLIMGIQMQWAGGKWMNAILWDALGLLIIHIGKVFKCSSGSSCQVHSMK